MHGKDGVGRDVNRRNRHAQRLQLPLRFAVADADDRRLLQHLPYGLPGLLAPHGTYAWA